MLNTRLVKKYKIDLDAFHLSVEEGAALNNDARVFLIQQQQYEHGLADRFIHREQARLIPSL